MPDIRISRLLCLFVGLGILASATLLAEVPSPPVALFAAPEFKTDVLPIFEAKCIRCHGARRRGGKLDMRTLEALLAGGDSGPALKPGNAQKSLLIELIHFKEMPPKNEEPRVTKDELDLLRAWIDGMSK